MPIPETLKPYLSTAKKIIEQGLVGEIEFSGGTYQVQMIDPKTKSEVWSFVQLSEEGQLKDCFCSCQESEDVSCCAHIAAAYLRIFNGHHQPLHQRFEESLWNRLCHLYADRLGYQPDLLKHSGKGQYVSTSVGGKRLFFIKGRNSAANKKLANLILHRHRETEETSLKFSNLPQEEILLWREGRPSSQLSYELSFWNDFAKWFMLLQESGAKYQITFDYSGRHIPNYITIKFPEIEFGFYLSEANLPEIIPSLRTVKSPLQVHSIDQETVKRIVYDKEEGCLFVEPKSGAILNKKIKFQPKGYTLGNWVFVEDDGFYPKNEKGLISTPKLGGKDLDRALNEHFHSIKKFLEGTTIHEEPVHASYALSFDKDWNLHINCYLFNLGDLERGDSRFFGDWVYLDEDGFYKLADRIFDNIETLIAHENVGEFVSQNRSWLNMQLGFETHLASVEAQLAYHLSADNKLTFSRRLAVADDSTESKDFGSWVYIAGQGFYSKISTHIGLPVRPDIAIGEDQIPVFVRMNRAELNLVPGFFSERCPVVKSGLIIRLDENENIHISPDYELLPAYKEKKLKFFDDFVYVEGEGFHELPVDSRLPERFRHPVEIDQDNQTLFLTFELPKIKQYTTFIDPKLLPPSTIELAATSINRAEEAGRGWYSLKLGYHTERGVIPISTIWTAIKKKKRFLFAEEGLIDLTQKRFDWLRLLGKNRIDRRGNTLLLSTLELIRLNAFDEIEVKKSKGSVYQESVELLRELTEFRIPDDPELSGLNSRLRPYQQQGLRWLWFLYHHSLSGLLCDDMGLGKTHQAMALLAAVINYHKKRGDYSPRHFLIVCPTSVIYHWQEKLAQYLPEARVCTFHGSNRSLGEFQKEYDILLTSYGIWRIENQLLSKVPFEVAIFDEVQIAKNHHSRIYHSLLEVNSQMRIGLTGTPIENHLRELKALFDVVVPTYMPGETDFREFFIKPIEREGNKERQELLTRFVKPFVLRRKKDQVLLDLPEKIEEVAHCELMPDQAKLYMEVLSRSRQKLIEELQDQSSPIPYMHIFAVLSSLKQICDHPAVYHKTPEKYKHYHSGKWDLFVELLSEARESRQKVVIFSQYLNMLDIIEEYLNETGIGYATIRGATQNRGEQIHRFNHDPNCEVFVGSLQAAGLGVDLTAGSVVIHYDRWWNAARENQATDRVHRIGQTRGVQVFKLVTKNTLEEKIDLLIFKKGRLMEEVMTVDDQQIIKQLNRNEIIQLLQDVEAP